MNKIILLDLNSTYAENAMQVHIMRKGIYNVNSEFYRKWLTTLLRKYKVIMLTSRPEYYKEQTLKRIKSLENWQPENAFFNKWRLPAPTAKEKMLHDLVWPEYGYMEETEYIAIESNFKTQDMFRSHGINAYTQQEIFKSPQLLDGGTETNKNFELNL